MNINTLKKLPPQQLVELAGKTGVKFHPRKSVKTILKEATDSPEDFARMILDAVTPQPNQQVSNEFDPTNPRISRLKALAELDKLNTQEMVEEALAPLKARIPQFESSYRTEDDGAVTWHFKCKGAEDCGNLAIPMRIILVKADLVSRGKVMPRGLNQHFDQFNVSGNNAYTNTVLAG